MGLKLSRFWAWMAVLLPAGFGAFLLFSPDVAAQSMPATAFVEQVGIRQLVYSGILLVALLSLPARVVGLIVAGRGVTDLADAVAAVAASGVTPQAMFPLVTAVFSFAAAYYLYTKAPSSGA